MNHQLTGFLCSLFIHAAAFGIFFCLSRGYASEPNLSTIDLSILETVAAPSGGGGAPAAHSVLSVKEPPRAKPVDCPQKAVSRPRPTKKSKPAVPPPLSVPAVEDTGPVPIAAVPEPDVLPEAQPGPGSEMTACSEGTGNGSGSRTESGSGSGGGGPNGTASDPAGLYLAEHFAYIKDMIQKNIAYPPRAKKMGWQGTVEVSFIVLESGKTMDIAIAKSSGYGVLDKNVVETIEEVQPFPKPPVAAKLKIPISYRLQ
nr:energy transducer TonB [Deltaproteobacteria bacterium]